MKSKGKISIESFETISDLVQAFGDGILRLENIFSISYGTFNVFEEFRI